MAKNKYEIASDQLLKKLFVEDDIGQAKNKYKEVNKKVIRLNSVGIDTTDLGTVVEIVNDEGKQKQLDSACEHVKTIFEIRVETIRTDLKHIQSSFILLGGHLIDIENSQEIKETFSIDLGRCCKNIYEFAQLKFNLSKTTVIALMSVCREFGECMTRVKSEYADYKYSQLVEMLPLSEEQRKLCNPKKTIKEIRELKKVQKPLKEIDPMSGQKSKPFNYAELVLKNDSERRDFVKNYKLWGVWLKVPELNLTFYKCETNVGDWIVVTEYTRFKANDQYGGLYYGLNDTACGTYAWHKCIVRKGTSKDSFGYDHIGIGDSMLCSWFKETKAKPLVCKEYKNLQEYLEDMNKQKEEKKDE